MKFKWELIHENDDCTFQTYRSKVFGGWIVHVMDCEYRTETSVFVPDPKHEWVIDNE